MLMTDWGLSIDWLDRKVDDFFINMKFAQKSLDFNPKMDRAFFYMCEFMNSVVYFAIMNYNISKAILNCIICLTTYRLIALPLGNC